MQRLTIRKAALGIAWGMTLPTLLLAQENLKSVSPPAPLPKITIPKLAGSIKIDGELDEAVWKKAAVIQTLPRNDHAGPDAMPTELRLWYNNTALFVSWLCHDQDIQATLTNRDDQLWNEEVVEFFVTPGELNRYFEFQWNPLNTVFDAIVTNRLDEHAASQGYQFDTNFTATNFICAGKVKGTINRSADKDTGWQIEAMIPFADLSQATPKPNAVWRANFFRFNRGANQPLELSGWSPTGSAWLHQPNRFGYLEFGK